MCIFVCIPPGNRSSNNSMGQQESEQRELKQVDVGRLCEWCPKAGYEMVQGHTNECLNIR